MQKEHLYFAIIGIGVLSVVALAVVYLWPQPRVSAAPVLEQTIVGNTDETTKLQAAKNIASHGPRARVEVRRSLQQYNGDDPQVRIALIDATANNLDWRSLPDLFRSMESPYPVVRARAAMAVEKIMGIRFFYKANDPPKARAAVLAQMRAEYEAMRGIQRFQKVYTDQTE